MRWWLALLVAALLLPGCASKPTTPGTALPAVAATPSGNATANVTLLPMRFAAGDREASMVVSDTYGPGDSCFFADESLCTGKPAHPIDVTALIPAEVPVELLASITMNGNFYVSVESTDTTLVQEASRYSQGTETLSATLVRAPAGTVSLVLHFVSPAAVSAASVAVTGTVHTISRATVVPAFIPVAVQLGPGDVVNATGDGLSQFVAFPPRGTPLRAVQFPFQLRIPDDAAAGTWLLVANADEAVHLTGPNRTLVAHQLAFVATDPQDIAPGQELTWEMPAEGYPLEAGVEVQTKGTVQGNSVAAFTTGFKATLTAPGNVPVVTYDQPCQLVVDCGFAILGSNGYGQSSELLDEHLLPGTYTASVTMDNGRDMQAFSWAVLIR